MKIVATLVYIASIAAAYCKFFFWLMSFWKPVCNVIESYLQILIYRLWQL